MNAVTATPNQPYGMETEEMCVEKVVLESGVAGTEPAISSRKSSLIDWLIELGFNGTFSTVRLYRALNI